PLDRTVKPQGLCCHLIDRNALGKHRSLIRGCHATPLNYYESATELSLPTQNNLLFVRMKSWPCATGMDARVISSLGSPMAIVLRTSPLAASTTTTFPPKSIV